MRLPWRKKKREYPWLLITQLDVAIFDAMSERERELSGYPAFLIDRGDGKLQLWPLDYLKRYEFAFRVRDDY